MSSGENPISIGLNGAKLEVIKEISNFPSHDHIWSKLRGFKRENNECVRDGEKTYLHKIKIVVFLFRICGAMTCISSWITSS